MATPIIRLAPLSLILALWYLHESQALKNPEAIDSFGWGSSKPVLADSPGDVFDGTLGAEGREQFLQLFAWLETEFSKHWFYLSTSAWKLKTFLTHRGKSATTPGAKSPQSTTPQHALQPMPCFRWRALLSLGDAPWTLYTHALSCACVGTSWTKQQLLPYTNQKTEMIMTFWEERQRAYSCEL